MSPSPLSFERHWLVIVASLVFSLPAVAEDAVAPATTPATTPARVRFVTTLGTFTVQLDPARAPLSVENVLQYVRDGHYDGTVFHRVVGNFVVQGGGYLPDGTERPVRTAVANESGNGLSNRRGTVAMARTDAPHSATSQFFVNLTDNLALDPGPTRWGYAVIGRVVEGMDVIDKIASVPTGARGSFPEDTPLEPILIESATLQGEPAVPTTTPATAQ
jgi:cyclophilin family peptidyl-prolyl cis-trans isomerase